MGWTIHTVLTVIDYPPPPRHRCRELLCIFNLEEVLHWMEEPSLALPSVFMQSGYWHAIIYNHWLAHLGYCISED